MSSLPLTNYLRANRKRLALTQGEVAFLLGVKVMDKGIKVCRDEKYVREPTLATALAYAVIYQKPVHELFAGMYEQIKREVAESARILGLRKDRRTGARAEYRRQVLANLAAREPEELVNT